MSGRIERLGRIFSFLPKSSRKAGDGQDSGPFPFFTSSQEQKKWTDQPDYSDEALVFGTGGSASIHHVNVPFSTSGDCLAARPIDSTQVNCRYGYHFLRWNIQVLEAGFRGSGLKHVSKKYIENLEIPLPLIEEQERVVALLDEIEELATKRRMSVAQLHSLEASIFLAMFDVPAETEWPPETVHTVAAEDPGSIRTGPFGSDLLHSEFTDEGIAVLGIDNVVTNEFRWKQRRYITEAKYRQLSRYTVKSGDVLITIMGTCGRCAVVPDEIPKAINTKHLCCITLDRDRCLPEFLHSYFLLHPRSRAYLKRKAKGAIMAGLNAGIIRELPILLPPIDLQREYRESVKSLRRLRAKMLESEVEIAHLFDSVRCAEFQKAAGHVR